MSKRRLEKPVKILIALLIFLLAVAGGYKFLTTHYAVSTVLVDGSVHYTDEEIKEIVMSGRYGNNSLYLSQKYKNKEITDVPFVQTINVEVVSNDTVRISVYEKALAGYIDYLGRYIYFDKDGIAVESSNVLTTGVPEVVGVDFDYVILHEKLPAEDPELFGKVLQVTHLMNKYSVKADKMYFKSNGDLVLYYKDIIINLGQNDDLDVKMSNLPSLLNNLEGRKGTLKMEKYSENETVSFVPNE